MSSRKEEQKKLWMNKETANTLTFCDRIPKDHTTLNRLL